MADIVEKTGARLISDGKDQRIENLYPYVTQKKVVDEKRAALAAFVQLLADTIAWAQAHPDEQASVLAPRIQFSETAIKTTFGRGARALQPIDERFLVQQQANFDELLAAGVLKAPVKAASLYLGEFNASITARSAGDR